VTAKGKFKAEAIVPSLKAPDVLALISINVLKLASSKRLYIELGELDPSTSRFLVGLTAPSALIFTANGNLNITQNQIIPFNEVVLEIESQETAEIQCINVKHLQYSQNTLLTGLYTAPQIIHHLLNRNKELGSTTENIALRAQSLIDTHFVDNPTIEWLAKEIGTNTTSLKASFKKQFGITLYKYQQQLKLKLAAALLENSDLSLTGIAIECGYADSRHLNTAFSKAIGESLGNYRKKFRGA
jgi:AraC-like DNA-binding protein